MKLLTSSCLTSAVGHQDRKRCSNAKSSSKVAELNWDRPTSGPKDNHHPCQYVITIIVAKI